MKVSYDWIREYYGDSIPSVVEVADLLGKHAFEIEEVQTSATDSDHNVIDVDVLPNRASDCLCHRGIARELASIVGTILEYDPLATSPELAKNNEIEVEIMNKEACPRFTASLITGVEVKESPEWLKKRLEAIGQRPINNIVDATNYVMFAIGQPIHAYDADLFPQVDGRWQFQVRYASAGETVSLIAEGGKDEDRVVELKGTELLIVDKSSNTPIGLAGVKGGRFAGVHAGTKKVIIEAAHFHPIVTRKTARRLGIVIDASKRFENEPSRELPPYAQSEIVKLILEIAGGEYQGTVDEYLERKDNKEVEVSVEKANLLLGLALSGEEMCDLLTKAGCTAYLDDKLELIRATGPFERTDLNIQEDFIEEIGRLHGYDHVESVVPESVPLTELNKRHYYGEKVRHVLVAQGFSEVITSSFRNKDKIQLLNALASDKSYVRSGLSKNLTEVLDRNAPLADYLGINDTRVFEIGTVFYNGESTVAEHLSLAIGLRQKPSGYSGKEDKILTGVLASINEELGVDIDWQIDKGVAETNLDAVLAELEMPTEYDVVERAEDIHYQPFSTYPYMTRDIALWVDDSTDESEVEKILNDNAGVLRVRTTLFDRFEKDSRTSLAFRLVFQATDRTLTDGEVNEVMDRVYKAVEEKGWEVR